jgi:hypothetical protein
MPSNAEDLNGKPQAIKNFRRQFRTQAENGSPETISGSMRQEEKVRFPSAISGHLSARAYLARVHSIF